MDQHHHRTAVAGPPWTLWRAGPLDAHAHPGPEHGFLTFLDDRRPEGHRSRIGSVLCAVDRPGALLLADRHRGDPDEIHMVSCSDPDPWVYRTSVYDELAGTHAETCDDLPGIPSWRHASGLAGDYWQTAMLLGDYLRHREQLDGAWQEPGAVEVHADPSAVRHA